MPYWVNDSIMWARCHRRDDSISHSVGHTRNILLNLPPLDIELGIEELGVLLDSFIQIALDFSLQLDEIERATSTVSRIRARAGGEDRFSELFHDPLAF